ncbi:MAG: 3-hydroxybutyryl-CoA dehydrogenase [Ignavibacteriae bacterium]|nr:3-hydroxybutyryl-CoA dehydrogenase [Ignavibacteriota bacterium]MCB9217100.1 3-hydroxybutyryl-CoA dehydrogenase [Ignavibacteria bacterium]
MASIVLVGELGVVEAAATHISEEVELLTLANDDAPSAESRLKRVETFKEIADNPAAVLLLATRDDGEIESTLALLDEELSGTGILLFVNTLFMTATEVSALVGNRFPVIGISWIPELTNVGELLEAAPALQVSSEDAARAIDLLNSLIPGEVEQVEDRVALVSARILAMIINEAAFAVMEDVADASDIDTAMKLGTNYPEGPLAWVDRIGADVIVGILYALHEEYGEERYRPCVLLKQYARAGKSFV